MKKLLIAALGLQLAYVAVASAQDAPATARPDKKEKKDKAATAPSNHGQQVSTVAKTTTLTGAEKGAAVSAAARDGRPATHGAGSHHERSARGQHGAGHGHANGAAHSGGGRGQGHGRGH
ncbi:hypothetical protein GCM10023185_19910 [Hymenobacter saemangeumensis]|uniref:Uncharacterized protein n=1 Tax=Hymenobacter saemangeumensis TaxID=1084522 RepID=A0ABP8IDE5_9BACT